MVQPIMEEHLQLLVLADQVVAEVVETQVVARVGRETRLRFLHHKEAMGVMELEVLQQTLVAAVAGQVQ